MPQKQSVFTVTKHKIGKNTYIVKSSASETAKDSLSEKIKKLLRKDIK